MTVREQRIVGAVQDERRCGDRPELRSNRVAAIDDVVVGHAGGDVRRAVDDAGRQGAQPRLVGADGPGEYALTVDDAIDDGVAIGPVRCSGRSGEHLLKVTGHGWQVGMVRTAGTAGTRGQKGQRPDSVGIVDRDALSDPAAHGDAHDVRCGHVQGVEEADGIADQVGLAVVGRSRRRRRGLPGVSEVVAHDESQPCRQPLAEGVLPPVHGTRGPADQEDRRMRPIAECLQAEIDPVDSFSLDTHGPSFPRRPNAGRAPSTPDLRE